MAADVQTQQQQQSPYAASSPILIARRTRTSSNSPTGGFMPVDTSSRSSAELAGSRSTQSSSPQKRTPTSPPLLARSASMRKKRGTVESAAHQQRCDDQLKKWRADVGIDDLKWLTPCTADSFGCRCQESDAQQAIEKQARADADLLNSMSSDPVTDLSITDCCADDYLTIVLSAVPRARVLYIHLSDDAVCTEHGCARRHALRFELRPVSEAFPPTPRVANRTLRESM